MKSLDQNEMLLVYVDLISQYSKLALGDIKSGKLHKLLIEALDYIDNNDSMKFNIIKEHILEEIVMTKLGSKL